MSFQLHHARLNCSSVVQRLSFPPIGFLSPNYITFATRVPFLLKTFGNSKRIKSNRFSEERSPLETRLLGETPSKCNKHPRNSFNFSDRLQIVLQLEFALDSERLRGVEHFPRTRFNGDDRSVGALRGRLPAIRFRSEKMIVFLLNSASSNTIYSGTHSAQISRYRPRRNTHRKHPDRFIRSVVSFSP